MSVKEIIDILSRFAEVNKILNEPFKVRAYINAISSLKKLPVTAKIKSCEDMLSKYYLTGISIKGSICKKIDEFLQTGHVQELNELENDDRTKKYRAIVSVQDIGPALAKKIINKFPDISSVDDLRKKVKKGEITLTKGQTLGLMHHDQLMQRVPRAEVTKITNELKKILKPLKLHIEITGSYRRGLPTTGDIDVLIVAAAGAETQVKQIVDLLIKKQLVHSDYFSMGSTKFRGITNTTVAHQIDIRLVPEESFATALMYFTGSKNFNLMTRRKAISLGYKLSEYSLFNKRTGKKEKVKTEKDIFRILGMKYLPPAERE